MRGVSVRYRFRGVESFELSKEAAVRHRFRGVEPLHADLYWVLGMTLEEDRFHQIQMKK